MPLFRTALVCIMFAACMLLVGCGETSEKITGAWKTESANPATGKPSVALFTKESANINGSLHQVQYNTVALTVDVFDKVNQNSVCFITKIEKDSLVLQGRNFQEKTKFIRISEEEAKQLLQEMEPS